ncbi:hypothetical protein Taro_035646, partial [Colocasia esculenta]|nr:hypothetical protein [Colocasia esculenta]
MISCRPAVPDSKTFSLGGPSSVDLLSQCTTLVEQKVHQRKRMLELEVVEKMMGFQVQGSWRRRAEEAGPHEHEADPLELEVVPLVLEAVPLELEADPPEPQGPLLGTPKCLKTAVKWAAYGSDLFKSALLKKFKTSGNAAMSSLSSKSTALGFNMVFPALRGLEGGLLEGWEDSDEEDEDEDEEVDFSETSGDESREEPHPLDWALLTLLTLLHGEEFAWVPLKQSGIEDDGDRGMGDQVDLSLTGVDTSATEAFFLWTGVDLSGDCVDL